MFQFLSTILTVFCFCSVAWVVLVIELLLEILIRPRDYSNLMDSDKAFTPSTARHISFFHIFYESIALASFVPEMWCHFQTAEMCHKNCMFSRSHSSLQAVLGRSPRAVLFGRFMMSITTFRFFGVVRHWKQALINETYQVVTESNGRKRLLRASTNDSISTYSSALSRKKEGKKKKVDVRCIADRTIFIGMTSHSLLFATLRVRMISMAKVKMR